MKHDPERDNLQAIRRALDQGARDLDASIAARLQRARNAALQKQQTASGMQLVTGSGSSGHSFMPQLRVALALVGLTLGVMGTYYWNTLEQVEENAEIDSALLADELPVDAYTDQGFQAWLVHTSYTSSQP